MLAHTFPTSTWLHSILFEVQQCKPIIQYGIFYSWLAVQEVCGWKEKGWEGIFSEYVLFSCGGQNYSMRSFIDGIFLSDFVSPISLLPRACLAKNHKIVQQRSDIGLCHTYSYIYSNWLHSSVCIGKGLASITATHILWAEDWYCTMGVSWEHHLTHISLQDTKKLPFLRETVAMYVKA